jgi:putative phosphoribosyl transferase
MVIWYNAMGNLRIISKQPVVFEDRAEAGRLLGIELKSYRGQNAVVLGIPRGGIIVAREIAKEIDGDLDIVLSRKLRTPGQPELAMGAVTEDGKQFINETIVREFSIDKSAIENEKNQEMNEIARRRTLIRKVYPKIPLNKRLVIITDDGVATGATTQAAIWAVRQEKPQYLVAAIPVGTEETIKHLGQDVDEMVCLCTPPYFMAVGQFYSFFEQVEDNDVIKVLSDIKANATHGGN